MKIGLISDTHIPSFSPEPPQQVLAAFRGVDLILHAGDIYATSCLDWLEQIAPVLAVEYGGPADDDPRVLEKRIVAVEGYTIAMMHALPLPRFASRPFQGNLAQDFAGEGALDQAVKTIFGRAADIVIHGHTHQEAVEQHQGILVVNPGSPTLPRHRAQLGTVALLDLGPQGATAQIVDLAAL